MSRATVATFRAPQDSAGATSLVFNAFSVAAGSYVICVAGSWEGGFGDPPGTPTDTINGTPSGKTWQVFYHGASRECWIAYCFDHPGGTNIVVTVPVQGGVNNRGYREGYGVVLEGASGEGDPRALAAVTSTQATGGTASFDFTRSGDGTLVASVTSVASLPGFTPTSPATQIDTLSTPTNYGAAMRSSVSGAGPTQTIASTGGQAGFLMNGIALAFNDPPGGDTTPPTITGPTGAAGAASISVNVAENTTACGTWTADESVTWSISGTDAAFFSINSSTGALAFLSAPDFEAPADSGGNNTYDVVVTATDTASPTPNTSNQSVAVNVTDATEDVTNPSAPGTPAFSSITKTGCTVTWTAATDNVAVTGYERRFNGGAAVDLGNVLTFDMTGQTPGATVTVEVRAYDAAGNRGAWSTANVTFPIYGFAFSTMPEAIFGAIVGAFTDIEREAAAASWTIYVHNDADREVILNTGALTIDSNGRVPDFSHASLDPITYFLSGRRPSDGAWVAGRLTATDLS